MRPHEIIGPLIAIAASLLISSVVYSQPHLIQTDCDTLSVTPLQIRFSFEIENSGEASVCRFTLSPLQSADSCGIQSCERPEGWFCGTSDGIGVWETELPSGAPPDCISDGESVGPFFVTVMSASCCYYVRYLVGGILDPFHVETVCFECDKPVQLFGTTWGRMKSFYR